MFLGILAVAIAAVVSVLGSSSDDSTDRSPPSSSPDNLYLRHFHNWGLSRITNRAPNPLPRSNPSHDLDTDDSDDTHESDQLQPSIPPSTTPSYPVDQSPSGYDGDAEDSLGSTDSWRARSRSRSRSRSSPVSVFQGDAGQGRLSGVERRGAAGVYDVRGSSVLTGQGAYVYVFDTGVSAVASMNVESPVWADFRGLKPRTDSDTSDDEAVHTNAPNAATIAATDYAGHGTAVAALVASTAHGVATGATVVSVGVMGGLTLEAGRVSRLVWAVDAAVYDFTRRDGGSSRGAALFLFSISWLKRDHYILGNAIDALANHPRIYTVAAAGQTARDACSRYPAGSPAVIAVAGLTYWTGYDGDGLRQPEMSFTDVFWDRSARGRCVDILAPATVLTSVAPRAPGGMGGGVEEEMVVCSGTSFAAALVAGVVAAWSVHPAHTSIWSIDHMRTWLKVNADTSAVVDRLPRDTTGDVVQLLPG
ncbi:hypothetical protein PYCC9005_005215 [Savitreella phatthalungensis]